MSTLRPGRVSQAIADLRDAALKEMDATPPGVTEKPDVEFDVDHAASRNTSPSNFDADNWVARYPGQNSPHIGNGSGGPK